ncbi:MAG TPA: FAD-dependent oxidoreductase, partial [Trueperaceae bacterium]|nr:FAD-dependent oxidoreductase [Trueperaceae bacterium]
MKYHSAIIGAGSAGLTVAIGLAGLGKQVVVIEKNHVGGDCTNVGCIPSKLLIHLANDAKDLTTSEIFARVRAKRDELRDEEDHWLKSQENIKFIKGEAKFIANDSLNVITETETITIKAENIIIASGSSPIIIPIKGLPIERTLTNENLFDLENLPKHIAIVGAGVIGCEMAFA